MASLTFTFAIGSIKNEEEDSGAFCKKANGLKEEFTIVIKILSIDVKYK